MNDYYEIHSTPYGVYVMNPIPVSELVAMTDVWKKRGFTICDQLIAHRLGASVAVTDKERGALWRKALGIENKENGT